MSNLPIQKPIDWRYATLNLVVLSIACAIGYWLKSVGGILNSAAALLILSDTLRSCLVAHHRLGSSYGKKGEFSMDAQEFQTNLDFFQRYPWLDQYRGITLLSSGHSYIETPLISLGFSYIQLKEVESALEYHQTCLRAYKPFLKPPLTPGRLEAILLTLRSNLKTQSKANS